MNRYHRIALDVLAHPEKHAQVTIDTAKYIDKVWSERRNAVKWIWQHREIWRTFIRERNEARKPKSNPTRIALMVNEKIHQKYGNALKMEFIRCKTNIGKKHELSFHKFWIEGMLQLETYSDTERLYRYVSEINAGVITDTDDLPWLGHLKPPHATEIVLWRLMRKK